MCHFCINLFYCSLVYTRSTARFCTPARPNFHEQTGYSFFSPQPPLNEIENENGNGIYFRIDSRNLNKPIAHHSANPSVRVPTALVCLCMRVSVCRPPNTWQHNKSGTQPQDIRLAAVRRPPPTDPSTGPLLREIIKCSQLATLLPTNPWNTPTNTQAHCLNEGPPRKDGCVVYSSPCLPTQTTLPSQQRMDCDGKLNPAPVLLRLLLMLLLFAQRGAWRMLPGRRGILYAVKPRHGSMPKRNWDFVGNRAANSVAPVRRVFRTARGHVSFAFPGRQGSPMSSLTNHLCQVVAPMAYYGTGAAVQVMEERAQFASGLVSHCTAGVFLLAGGLAMIDGTGPMKWEQFI